MNEKQLYETFGRSYPAGHVLFREGEPGSEMYVIQSGEVEISRLIKGVDTPLAVLPAGEFFGEMAIVNDRPRSATATVHSDARLLVIDGETFEAMLRGKVEIAVRMIKTMADRLEQANQQIDLLLLEDANHRVVQCLRQLSAKAHTKARGAGVLIPATLSSIAARVALPEDTVAGVIRKLTEAKLISTAEQAGIDGPGYVVPEVGRLVEFLEFLEMKDRFRGA